MPQNNLFFPFQNQSKVGVPAQLDAEGNMPMAPGQPAYYAQANAGRMFRGGNQSGATLSAALATTYVGLCLSNPAASGKNLIVTRVTGQIIVAPAAVLALGLIEGYAAAGVVTHTTPLGINPALSGGSATSIAKLDAACTIVGTPLWTDWPWSNGLSANLGGFALDLQGSAIIEPGGYMAIGGNVAGPTAGFVGSFRWIEQ